MHNIKRSVLVVGATGATGRHAVKLLLDKGYKVKVIVRSPEKLLYSPDQKDSLEIIKGSILDLSPDLIRETLSDCEAVISCLGHRGIYGGPKKLVTDAIKLLSKGVADNKKSDKVKFILMNTSGNRNKDTNEKQTLGEKTVIGLVRMLIPAHSDNEMAAEFLRKDIGKENGFLTWVVVRPDDLIDKDVPSSYVIEPSPVRSPIFNAGKSSRINVAHFMAELVDDQSLWSKWEYQMPVLYNS